MKALDEAATPVPPTRPTNRAIATFRKTGRFDGIDGGAAGSTTDKEFARSWARPASS